MYIRELFTRQKPVISFEIFPPKADSGVETIYKTIEELAGLQPDFISVTYSAGGVGSDKTVEIASMTKNEFGIEALAHLTGITSNRNKIASIIDELQNNNIKNILALRGDIPAGFSGDIHYPYASDLIKDIKASNSFCIGAAAYPEGHIDCVDIKTDIENLKKKVDAGADFLITQLFFDNKLFYDFLTMKEKASINVPISVGVMPILSQKQVEKMIFMCGASLPSKIIRILNKYQNDPESIRQVGIEYAAEQVQDLLSNGVDGVHIYTMNQPEIAKKILSYLKLNAAQTACG